MRIPLSLKEGLFYTILVLSLSSCKHMVVDPSIPAVEAQDYTLAISACEAAPGIGMDICRVREGTRIESSWILIVPAKGKAIKGGEVDVYYKDVHRSYGITDEVVEIPWRDFFGSDKWTLAMDGEALALVTIRYRTAEGLDEVAKYRGIAKLVVTKPGYDRMPIDSGYGMYRTKCEVHYSTAGRSAIRCK